MTAPITSILLDDDLQGGLKKKAREEEENLQSADNEVETDNSEETDNGAEADNDEEESLYVEYFALDGEDEPGISEVFEGKQEANAESEDNTQATGSETGDAQESKKPSKRTSVRLRHIPSIPNLRALLWDRQRKPVVFRSARQECIAFEDLKPFMDFEVKTIIDLRSCHEYSSTSGDRLLDRIYPVFEVQIPKDGAKFNANEMKCTQVSYNYPEEDMAMLQQFVRPEETEQKRRRLLIPICNKQYLLALAKEIGGYHQTMVRALADVATFFKFGFLTRRFVQHFNGAGQWRLYVSYLEHGANAIVAALKTINEPQNLPVLINCHVGKDRTGVLSAILLTIVGVAREDILKDFSRSEEGIQLVRDEIREYMTSQRMFFDEEFLHAFPDDLLQCLRYIDEKHGSLNNFLHLQGFTFDEQARLKDNLLAGSISSWRGEGGGGVGVSIKDQVTGTWSRWSQVI